MVSDMFRGAGFEVVDLGHDLPTAEFVEAAIDARPLIAVAVSVSTTSTLGPAKTLIEALHASLGVPIVVGGGAVPDEALAAELGADAHAGDGPEAVTFVETLVTG
jgi:5-methyltetrahydrofolate--homocysteine methyltransferase